jgi:hypothetical protein
MSSCLNLVFKRPLPRSKPQRESKFSALGDQLEALDEIAWEIGARPLSNMIEGYASDEIDPWFSAKTGVMTIGALLSFLQNNADRVGDLEAVMDDLRNVKKPLSQAADELIPFRFIMS